jgi:hypothetical protein
MKEVALYVKRSDFADRKMTNTPLVLLKTLFIPLWCRWSARNSEEVEVQARNLSEGPICV